MRMSCQNILQAAGLLSWIIPLMTCSKYQFWTLRALAYLLMILVYLIYIDLRKENGTDQYRIMLIENWLLPWMHIIWYVHANRMTKIK